MGIIVVSSCVSQPTGGVVSRTSSEISSVVAIIIVISSLKIGMYFSVSELNSISTRSCHPVVSVSGSKTLSRLVTCRLGLFLGSPKSSRLQLTRSAASS
ncbi:hypothetical protein GDO78_003692 [Eleutherodactylus coqui]|uniref:Uncharacterized protein n=1 Tax=Eleutherodactylus coqui TaxID=57060 RepID=A0A8J6EUJ9_ELECQ|nr:hypothetical protein GDO78_003692 [Eleutherodactylus coqui]